VSSKREELEQRGEQADTIEKQVGEFREAEIKAAKTVKAAAAQAKAMKAGGQDAGDEQTEAEGAAGADFSAEAAATAADATLDASGKAEAEAELAAGAEASAEAVPKTEAEAELAPGAELSAEAAAKEEHEADTELSGREVPPGAMTKGEHVSKKAGPPRPPPSKPGKFKAVVIDGPNKEYLSEVQDDISTILSCKTFRDIATEDPLPISKDAECGIQEPFDSEQCKIALKRRGVYISGFNFFWLDFLRSPTPGIPLSRERVRELANYMFQDGPVALKKPIGVVVTSADFPVEAHKGSLLMITPEEKAHAILLKVAEDVRHGAKRSKLWKLVLLSVPVSIEVIVKEEQVQWEAFNARQLVFQEHWTMTRTAQQQCYEVLRSRRAC